jgi:NAD-dependent SIR2 family protein deacetylase
MDPLIALCHGKKLAVLTGAGCSTESGIPDYRGPTTRERTRSPIQYRAFVDDPVARRRYWARSMAGWTRFSSARPNRAHAALAAMDGRLTGLVTQNVDRLHHAAGSRDVIELHGALHEVGCLACGGVEERHALQRRLILLNPGFDDDAELAPDGDAELAHTERFRVPDCLACGGVLKPRVVFFGENVARPVVDAAFARVDAADVLLVVGSSLTVFSGFRFVKHAHARGKPVAIVNLGPTRGDPLATLKVDAPAGETLATLAG